MFKLVIFFSGKLPKNEFKIKSSYLYVYVSLKTADVPLSKSNVTWFLFLT